MVTSKRRKRQVSYIAVFKGYILKGTHVSDKYTGESFRSFKYPDRCSGHRKGGINYNGVYVSARNVSVFHYDNDVFILYAHITDRAHPIHAQIHIPDENAKLFDLSGQNEIKLSKHEFKFHFETVRELAGDVILEPGEFYAYIIKKQDKESENKTENDNKIGDASDKEFDWRKTC